MKSFFKLLCLILTMLLLSCEHDDSTKACSDDCTTVKGRISRADNTGIQGIQVTFSYTFSAPYSYRRIIAKTVTDQNGNYEMHGYIKDSELGESNHFQILIDKSKLESSLTANYLKPSELMITGFPKVDEIIFPILDRNEIVNVPNFIVPYKTDLTINLNNYTPTVQTDSFGFEQSVEYGFENQFILCSNKHATGANSQFNVTTALGNNRVKIYKWKNNIDSYPTEEINLTTIPSNQIMNFEY